ncbi:MAG TPA: WecB/TagA/CpsF family glycosyltransferase [Capsulimonadaceae bacterium]|jgi:N-acetylglucosaminyldiphosphoundecaprenol N-acetyl-beta-D-mannosaminyltransferase
MDRIQLLGLSVDRLNMDEALATINGYIAQGTPHHVVTADASMVVIAREDADLSAIVQRADLITPDGAGLVWASKLLGTPIVDRVSGVDLVARLCEVSAKTGIKLYFLGAAPGVADDAAANLRIKYPGANIVGTRHGYYGADEEPTVVAGIREMAPDVLLVAFGIPKQEKFITKHRDAMQVPVSIGIGGSFDVYSGRVKRAPLWMQRAGLEWLFRLAQNPKKISKVMTLPRFVVLAVKTKLSRS